MLMNWVQTDTDQWVIEISEDIYRILTIVHRLENAQEKYALKDAVVNLSYLEEKDFDYIAKESKTDLSFIKAKKGERWRRYIAELYVINYSPYFLSVPHESYPALLSYIKEKYRLENDEDAIYE